MIHQDIKGLVIECDAVISKFKSLNIPITDTQNEHTLMVFILRRKGNTLEAYSPTKAVRSCDIQLDDVFHMDELLQELHSSCLNSIRESERYEEKDGE